MVKFVHLHTHSEYSLLDGISKIKELVKKTKELGMEAIALTDHGGMYGAIEFYKECLAQNIKPIIGCEMYVAPRSHRDKEGKVDAEPYHLTVLAKDYQGYLNLMKLVSISHLDGYYYRPRVDKQLLSEYHDGLVVLSACPAGEFIRSLESGGIKKAEAVAQEYLEIFGEGNYYFELQNHHYDEVLKNPNLEPLVRQDMQNLQSLQEKTWEAVKVLSNKSAIPIVATNDLHYVDKNDAEAHDAVLCVQTGKFVSDIQRLRMIDSPDFYLKSPEEMLEDFADMPEALENTLKIAAKVNLELDLGKSIIPVFPTPDGKTPDQYLREWTYEGAKEKFGEQLNEEIKDRLEYELDIIEHKKYADYFLMVADFINWSHEQGIITNTRGSAAGSLVLYCLGVTILNPLDYLLPFERFLTKHRPTMPDVDADIADDRRDDIIRYLMQRYGENRVAHIVTFGTMMGRAAIRDIGRVLQIPLAEVDRIAKLVPIPKQGFHTSLTEHLKNVPELNEIYRTRPEYKTMLDLACKIEGTVRHASVHAAGILITPDEITNYTPIQRESNGDKIVSQYDMFSTVDEYGGIGVVKLDLLGIRNLSILGRAVEYVRANLGVEVDLNSIPLNDKKTYDLLARGETIGVFQLASDGMTRYLMELKPTSIADLAAMVSLYRPGPMGIIPEYIARKNNPKLVAYFDPRMKEYMKQSLGLLVYQEDVLYTVMNIAGYTWEKADKFRKAMGKKKPEEMAKQKIDFIKGCVENGMNEKKAEELFILIAPFAAYGFNKCVTGDTLVYDVNTGEKVTIETLYHLNKKVQLYSIDGNYSLKPKKVISVKENGKKLVYEVITSRGLRIKVTANHPFLTFSGWLNLKDLRVGDTIGTARKAPMSIEPYPIENFKLSTLGYLIAEGNLCHPNGVYYYSKSPIEREDFIQNTIQFKNSKISINYSKNTPSVYIGKKDPKGEKELFNWLNDLNLLNKRATEKFLPDFVYRLNQDQLSLFLAKIWQGDGCITESEGGQFYYTTSSKKLAYQYQHLLLRLEIISTVHKLNKKYRRNILTGYSINISRYINIENFAKTIGRHLIGESLEKLERILGKHPIISGTLSKISKRGTKDIIPAMVLPIIKEEIYKSFSTLQSFIAQSGIAERLMWVDTKKIGYQRETLQKIAFTLNSHKLQTIGNSDIYWDKILEINKVGLEMTYDLTISETHNFVANDIIVHNSHAASYAMISYQTAYMKANFPVEYMAAIMTAEYGDIDKIAEAIEECKRMGIVVLPPDINYSGVGFKIEDLKSLSEEDLERQISDVEVKEHKQGIRFGLSAIKNVGISAIESILSAREQNLFISLNDLCSRVDNRLVNKKTLESLIKAGALDSFGYRAAQLIALDKCLDEAHKSSRQKVSGQTSLFDGLEEETGDAKSLGNFVLPDVDEIPLEAMLQFEKDLLGFYLHEPPYLNRLNQLGQFTSSKISDLSEADIGKRVRIGGVIVETKKVITKKSGAEMAFIKVFDGSKQIEGVVFPKTYLECKDCLIKEEVVLIDGKFDYKEEEPSIIVDVLEVFDPTTANRVDLTVEIEIPRGADGQLLQQINTALRKFPGPAPIAILIPRGETFQKMNLAITVSPDTELVRNIEQILGPNTIRLI